MKCKEIEILLPEYIDEKLNEELQLIVSNHLENCSNCQAKYIEIKSFLEFTDSTPEIEPPANMKEEFLAVADMETESSKRKILYLPVWLKVAAIITFALGTFSIGYFTGSNKQENRQLRAEMENLKQQVYLTSLQEQSGPQKIQAVYNVVSTNNHSKELVATLIHTMNSDKNINVRLAALSVLSEMVTSNQIVKKALIESLKIQNNPLVQISLVQALTESGVKEAKEEIEQLSNSKSTDPSVKDFAKNMVKTI